MPRRNLSAALLAIVTTSSAAGAAGTAGRWISAGLFGVCAACLVVLVWSRYPDDPARRR